MGSPPGVTFIRGLGGGPAFAMAQGMEIEFGSKTIEGRRASNEDAYCVLPDIGLFAVADGMGGYEGGEVASRLCIETLAGFWRRIQRGDNLVLPIDINYELAPAENVSAAAIQLANQRIKAQRHGTLAQMGTTVAAVQLVGNELVVAHVGDSRVYRLPGAQLTQLTRDHSLYEELRASGNDVGPSKGFRHGHVITRALGLENDANHPDLQTCELLVGDTLLLCTDGLTDVLSDDEIAMRLANFDLQFAAELLVGCAFEAGSKDNITVVILRRVS